jgi:hypothetical protein
MQLQHKQRISPLHREVAEPVLNELAASTGFTCGIGVPIGSEVIMVAVAEPPPPMAFICPGLAIVLTVYAFNMLGDALRDVLDPRLRHIR